MKNFLVVSMMVLMATLMLSCGLSPEQRQGMIHEIRDRVTAEVLEKSQEIAADVSEKAVESITKKATELGLSPEKAKQLGQEAADRAREAVTKLIEERVPAAIESAANKIIPEATTAEGGTGKGILGGLFGLAQILLGMGSRGGLA